MIHHSWKRNNAPVFCAFLCPIGHNPTKTKVLKQKSGFCKETRFLFLFSIFHEFSKLLDLWSADHVNTAS